MSYFILNSTSRQVVGIFAIQSDADAFRLTNSDFIADEIGERLNYDVLVDIGWTITVDGILRIKPKLSDEQYIIPLVKRTNQAYTAGMLNIKDWWADNLIDSEDFGKEAVEATRKWLFHTAAHCFNILHDETALLAGRQGKEAAVAHLEALSSELALRDYWKLVIENEITTGFYLGLSVGVGTKTVTDAYDGVVGTTPTGIERVQAGSFISSNFNPI